MCRSPRSLLGVNRSARDLNKVFIASGAGTADLTGKACSPNTVHGPTTRGSSATALPRRCSRAAETAGTSSPPITPSERTSKRAPAKRSPELGGKVLGSARVPLGASDFPSFPFAGASPPSRRSLPLANAGGDLTNTLKQAAEFGLTDKFQMPSFVFNPNNARAIGLRAAQGVLAASPFYWDDE